MLILSNILGEISDEHVINECNKNLKKLGVSSKFDINSIRKYIAYERLN